MMSSTDGSGRSRFVFSNLVSPEKMAVDNIKQRYATTLCIVYYITKLITVRVFPLSKFLEGSFVVRTGNQWHFLSTANKLSMCIFVSVSAGMFFVCLSLSIKQY